MAHDTTPPRNKMILVFTLLSPVLLIALVPLFHDYFLDMTEGEVAARVAEAPPTIRDATFAAQRQHLETGPMPIERAMREMASRGRDASPVIAPTPSDDTAAVSGWGPMEDAAAAAAAQAAHERAHRPPPPPAPVVPSGVVLGGTLPTALPPVPAP
ncbi:MAG: hypothetical protein GXP55_12225 [Deltaproteobacteria bacterium]|nr:hypothetical protein [Deltaproteobacteria bacterium]